MAFKIGDTVYLKSGSPAMTVTKIYGYDQDDDGFKYDCSWFAGKKSERARYPADALTQTDPLASKK